jgi:hypothetical protein
MPAYANPDSPVAAVRFTYHPGAAALRDDSGLACRPCWDELAGWLGAPAESRCAICGERVPWRESLHVRRYDETAGWQLCAPHAAGLLNRLRTVEPKLDPETFRLPSAPAANDENA